MPLQMQIVSPGHQVWNAQESGSVIEVALGKHRPPILIQDQGEVVQISVSLMEGATISGKILRSSGEIAGGVAVIAERIGYTGGDLEPVSRAETTELDGYFEIKGLPNGQYIVGVVLSWWTDDVWWYPGKLEPAAADTVLIRDFRSVTGLDWQMPI